MARVSVRLKCSTRQQNDGIRAQVEDISAPRRRPRLIGRAVENAHWLPGTPGGRKARAEMTRLSPRADYEAVPFGDAGEQAGTGVGDGNWANHPLKTCGTDGFDQPIR